MARQPKKDMASSLAERDGGLVVDSLEDEDGLPDDEQTVRAVNDIIAHESDELLAAQDAAAARNAPLPRRRGFWRSIGHGFALWLGRPAGRWLTAAVVVALAGAVAALPQLRYRLLNDTHVRASASILVTDELTDRAVPGVPVVLAGSTRTTDSQGVAHFSGLRLGYAQLSINRPGYARVNRQVVIGWGSNPLGTYSLQTVGVRYAVEVHDYLSGQPLPGVLAVSGGVSAVSDAHGAITLPLANISIASDPVTFSKDGYRTDKIMLANAGQTTKVVLVPARQTAYVSTQNGKYDVYKSDIDGANLQLLLPANGTEDGAISLSVSPDGNRVALVSKRDGQQAGDGTPLTSLTIITMDDGTTITVAHAPHIQLIDWFGTRIVFEQTADTPSSATLISYDYASNSRAQLASAAQLVGVWSIAGTIYYAVSAQAAGTPASAGLYKVNPDGTSNRQLLQTNALSGLRTDYTQLALQTSDGWLAYDTARDLQTTISGPNSSTSRNYLDSADHRKSLWIQQGTIMVHDTATGKDTPLPTTPAARYPLSWFGDSNVLFRATSGSISTDYVANLGGSAAHKVADTWTSYGLSPGL